MKTTVSLCSALLFALTNLGGAYAARYFVTVDGAGARSGESWEQAFSNDELIQLFDGAFLEDGDSVFVAAGTYTTNGSAGGSGDPAAMLYCTAAVSIFGGYPNGQTGADIDMEYPTTNETVFSGDLLQGGVANETCSSSFLYYYTDNKEVSIKGISFAYCYHAGANNLTGYNYDNVMSDANGYGALVLERTNATVQWCKFYNNATPPATSSSDGSRYYGGALNVQNCRLVHVSDCIFRDNYAARCGAAIAIKSPNTEIGQEPSTVLIQRSLFDKNNLSTAFNGRYGGAIAINSTGYCYIVNSTFARASYYSNGGALSGDSGATFYLISSTFAENDNYHYYSSASTGGSYGYNIRGKNSVFRLANTINVNNKNDKYGYSITSGDSYYNKVCGIYNESFTSGDQIMFSGYNLTGVGGTLKADTTAIYLPTDTRQIYYEDVFNKTYDVNDPASTSLADNGGFSLSMKPVAEFAGMPQSQFPTLKSLWNIPNPIWELIDFTVDQRGYIRSENETSPGAFDPKATPPNPMQLVKNPAKGAGIEWKKTGKNVYTLSNVDRATVALCGVNGVTLQVKEMKEGDAIDVSAYPKGVYILKANGSTFKMIK